MKSLVQFFAAAIYILDQLEYTQRAAVDYVLPVYTIYKDDKTIPFDERWDKKIESYYYAHYSNSTVVIVVDKRKKWIQVMWKDDKGMLKSGWIQNYKTEELSSKKR